ncbi:ribosomal RNA processing protein [Orbilia oligospora]|uniref:ATP-dependent rRNA helicase RRP3 n=1 Tax=Orbilia oligospora TaxID=2813651 RepID=A0A7C8K7A9_ORBOL|nr:ribosomal RNA processing protein [Orbilia oligospora]KAF3110083.1 ribosomal RNA processing protein [Orbilia oligospora]KAF3138002.1 ribosomal RNA processing protein [Orbilia oligospora]KAF3143738.1 ribosomal RNA processing protein [Orbilia oligospora]KAF3153217.1 ribosomal RNA processing protein [Orbilia oligospora]
MERDRQHKTKKRKISKPQNEDELVPSTTPSLSDLVASIKKNTQAQAQNNVAASSGKPSSAKSESESDGDVKKRKKQSSGDSDVEETGTGKAGEDVVQGEGEEEEESKSFKELEIIDQLCETLETLKFHKPTPIQQASIPLALAGKDLIGLAETGSGKTAAFALPILQALYHSPHSTLFACILAPTRELAFQISEQTEAIGGSLGVKTCVIVGGMDMMPQAIALSKRPHIIVATPGRLLDHLENTKGFSLRSLKYLVMDEADRLLDLDFGPIIEKILKVLPPQRNTYLFSATMTDKVERLQRMSLTNPVRVAVSSKYQTVKSLLQYFMLIPQKDKDTYLVYLVAEKFAGKTMIIFTRTIMDAQRISVLLRLLGCSAIPLHGQLSQTGRLGALNKFKAGTRNILVATDVAARGLDIPTVDYVINYDIAGDSKTYIHRVGRTARAGRSGVCVNLVTQYDIEEFTRIEKALGKKLDPLEVEKGEVSLLAESVGEAQRQAIKEVKEWQEKKKEKGAGRKMRTGKRDNMDKEEI